MFALLATFSHQLTINGSLIELVDKMVAKARWSKNSH
jgi:hypothetical protein